MDAGLFNNFGQPRRPAPIWWGLAGRPPPAIPRRGIDGLPFNGLTDYQEHQAFAFAASSGVSARARGERMLPPTSQCTSGNAASADWVLRRGEAGHSAQDGGSLFLSVCRLGFCTVVGYIRKPARTAVVWFGLLLAVINGELTKLEGREEGRCPASAYAGACKDYG